MADIARQDIAQDWVFLLLLAFVLSLALIRERYPGRFRHLFVFHGSESYVLYYAGKKQGLRHAFTAVMILYQSAVLSLALFTCFKLSDALPIPALPDGELFLFLTLALFSLKLLNALLHFFFSSFFELEKRAPRYLIAKYYFLFLGCLPLLPLLFSVYYTPLATVRSLEILLAYLVFYPFLWQIWLVCTSWKRMKGYRLYFFLYLCSLEVLPLLWIAKFLLF